LVAEQGADGDVTTDGGVGQVGGQWRIEVDAPLVDELQDHRGDKRLDDAGDQEPGGGRDRVAGGVGRTCRRGGRHAVVGDEHRHATRFGADEAGGHLVEADLADRREELLVLVEVAGEQVERLAGEDVDQLLALQ
jgi:hypothetical protein